MESRIRYVLQHPIEQLVGPEGEERHMLTELSLAPRVKGKHMARTDGAAGPTAQKIALIAALSGLSNRDAGELDFDDIEAIEALYNTPADATGPAASTIAGAPAEGPLESSHKDGQPTGAPSSAT